MGLILFWVFGSPFFSSLRVLAGCKGFFIGAFGCFLVGLCFSALSAFIPVSFYVGPPVLLALFVVALLANWVKPISRHRVFVKLTDGFFNFAAFAKLHGSCLVRLGINS
jgi:hypothetical protein